MTGVFLKRTLLESFGPHAREYLKQIWRDFLVIKRPFRYLAILTAVLVVAVTTAA